jgi:hypothetical protein
MNKKEAILEFYPDEEFLFADGFDAAILGVSSYSRKIVYSISKCIDILAEEMDYEEAIEYFEFNVLGSYVGEKTPVFVEDNLF